MKTLNEPFSTLAVRRRYEVWFLRVGLADGSGAWWFRYLLMNPGIGGCGADSRRTDSQGMPVQVWATWFPRGGKPESFIQGFPLEEFELSAPGQAPLHFQIGSNAIDEGSCRGALDIQGRKVSWNLSYASTFRVTLSAKGWIGFSRTPHSDAIFSGQIRLDDRTFCGAPLGFGVQGHNCGYRHRKFWRWGHAYFARAAQAPTLATTIEVLMYEMPLGLRFRKAVLWHEGEQHIFRKLQEVAQDRETMQWHLRSQAENGMEIELIMDGAGKSAHRLPYLKTDCTGSFAVTNNSLAEAVLCVQKQNQTTQRLETTTGAVLEMGGLEGM